MIDYRMRFYVHEDLQGNYHVQNIVAGLTGQHHVYSEKGFQFWRANVPNIPEEDIIFLNPPQACPCGLVPGDVREYDGKLWHKEEFE